MEPNETIEPDASRFASIVERLIDEALALIIVVPITAILVYLAYVDRLDPQVLLAPYGMIITYFFTKSTSK